MDIIITTGPIKDKISGDLIVQQICNFYKNPIKNIIFHMLKIEKYLFFQFL